MIAADPAMLALLFTVALAAGALDAIAGGGRASRADRCRALLRLRPPPERGERRARLAFAWFVPLVIPPLALYDGIFGPGTGMLMMIAFLTLNGRHLVEANALTKLSNTSSNFGAFASFLTTGYIEGRIAAVMIVGAVAGGQIGSRLALRHGARPIRPVVVAFCCALAVKLLADPANPLRAGAASLFARN